MFDATQQDVSCGGGVGWGGYDDVNLHLHTCLMLRNRMHLHTFWISRFCMCALKLLSSNVACASCLFLFKNHKFHMRQKKDAKTSQNTDVSNVHFLLQITYETHDH